MVLFGLLLSIIAAFIVISAVDNAIKNRKSDEISNLIERSRHYGDQHHYIS